MNNVKKDRVIRNAPFFVLSSKLVVSKNKGRNDIESEI